MDLFLKRHPEISVRNTEILYKAKFTNILVSYVYQSIFLLRKGYVFIMIILLLNNYIFK